MSTQHDQNTAPLDLQTNRPDEADSLPFEAGENHKIAVKVVDDQGIESLKVMGLES